MCRFINLLLLVCMISATSMASAIEVVFETTASGEFCSLSGCVPSYSSVSSDLTGNGIDALNTPLFTPTVFSMLIDSAFFQPDAISAPGDDRSWSSSQSSVTFSGIPLSPTPITYSTTGYAFRTIGYSFAAGFGLSGTVTTIAGGTRYDESGSLNWEQPYSNDISDATTATTQPGFCPDFELNCPVYSVAMNLYQTLIDFENNQRTFDFSFTSVWSDPNTYLYEGNSTWSGSAQIIGVYDEQPVQLAFDQTPAAESSTAFLVIPALLGMFAYLAKRQRRRKAALVDCERNGLQEDAPNPQRADL